MSTIILISSLIFLFIIIISVFFAPMFSLGTILLIRSSIGPLRDLAWYPFGMKINILAIFGAAIMVVGIIYIILKRALPKNQFFILYFLFILWAVITITYSLDPKESIYELFRFVTPMLFFLIVLKETPSWEKKYLLLKMIVLSSILPIAFGLFQFATGTGGSTRAGFNRIKSFFIFPNPFAFYLGLIAITCICLVYLNITRRSKILYLLLCLLSTGCLILTATRTALLGFVAGVVSYVFLNRKWLLLFFALLFISLVIGTHPHILSRFSEPVRAFTSKKGLDLQKGLDTKIPVWEMNTFQNRLRIWKVAIDAFKKRPILGHGIGTIKKIIPIECHNDYLRLLVEVGIIGFILYIASFTVLLISKIKLFYLSSDFLQKNIVSTCISLIISFMVIMLGDNTITANTYLFYLFSIVAISYFPFEFNTNKNKFALYDTKK